MSAAQKTIIKQYTEFNDCSLQGISMYLLMDNMFKWIVEFSQLYDTPYQGIILKGVLIFPSDYPFSPPIFRFETPIFHPNIDYKGIVCFNFKDEWSPQITITGFLLSIQHILNQPNIENPSDPEAAELYISNKKGFDQTAKEWNEIYSIETYC